MCTCLAVWGKVARREWPRLALEALPLKCWDFKPGHPCSIGNLFAFKVAHSFVMCKEYHGVLYAFFICFPPILVGFCIWVLLWKHRDGMFGL